MVVRGHIHDGEIVLDREVALPDGAAVEVTIMPISAAGSPVGEVPTLLERLKDVVGVIDDLPEDSSVNLDHYLYGAPKR